MCVWSTSCGVVCALLKNGQCMRIDVVGVPIFHRLLMPLIVDDQYQSDDFVGFVMQKLYAETKEKKKKNKNFKFNFV